MKINDDLILGVLFSSWIQSLVLEYKRKKSAFVLVEFNSPQRSDSPAHKHTKLLCCVNGVSSEVQSSKYLPVFVLRGGRFCTVRGNGSCTQIEISPARQCSVIVDKGKRTKESSGHWHHAVAGHGLVSPPGNLTCFYSSSRGGMRASVRSWAWGLASISCGTCYCKNSICSPEGKCLRMSYKQGLLLIHVLCFKEQECPLGRAHAFLFCLSPIYIV